MTQQVDEVHVLFAQFVENVGITGKVDAARNLHPTLGIIDHGSRLALCMQPLPDKRAITVLKALLIAVEMFGPPQTLKTDNEAIFRSRLFRWSLALLSVRHRFSQPGMPWQNGRIKRLFGTLKEKLDHPDPRARAVLDRAALPATPSAAALDPVARLVAGTGGLCAAIPRPGAHHAGVPGHHHRIAQRHFSAAKRETFSISGLPERGGFLFRKEDTLRNRRRMALRLSNLRPSTRP
ncbi:MAG TPA: hypothetical protein VEC06_20335 [Paucimonas sp.]|nr:hypothetical protein [Paucimonas sp.]